MPSEASTGTQTATIAVPHLLATISTPGVYQLYVSLENLSGGDGDSVDFVNVITATLTSTPMPTKTETKLPGADDLIYFTVPYAIMHSIGFYLTQTAGVGKDFPWSIVRLDA